MIIRCDVCGAGRWKSPPAVIFREPYRQGGGGLRVRPPRPFIGEARRRELVGKHHGM
jgi:hypothetical protein